MTTTTANGTPVQIKTGTTGHYRIYRAVINGRCIGSGEVRRDLVSWVRRQVRDERGEVLS